MLNNYLIKPSLFQSWDLLYINIERYKNFYCILNFQPTNSTKNTDDRFDLLDDENISSQINDDIDISEIWQGIHRKRKILLFTAGFVLFATAIFTGYARIYRPIYKGSFSLLISDPMNTNNSKQDRFTNRTSSLIEDIAINSATYETSTLITLLKSPLFLNKVSKEFDLTSNELTKMISIDQNTNIASRKSQAEGILNINITIKDKIKGKKILQRLSEVYLQASLRRRQQKLNDGLEFLDKQAPAIQNKTNELQTKLVAFREKYKLIEPEIEGTVLKKQQNIIDQEILNLNSKRNRLENVRLEIKNRSLTARGFKDEMGDGLSVSDFDQSLLQQLITVEKELAKAKSKYTSSSSIVKGLELRLLQIQPILLKNQLEAVDTALSLNAGRLSNAFNQKEKIERRFLEQPALIKQYKNIEQEIKIANQNLVSLENARESFQLEMAQNSIPWVVISEPAMNNRPIKPSIKDNLFLGSFIGLLLGILAALIRDRMDHVFHYPEEVKESIKVPLLGHIPHVDAFEKVREARSSMIDELINKENNINDSTKKNRYQRFFYQEAFRNLFTSIRFLNADKRVNSLVLTSSLPMEGKTLINILLAKTLADMGERILLIDADIRKPQLHYRLAINNLVGFSNLLAESDLCLKDVIKPIKDCENWSVITGGTTAPDPTRLLSSKRMKDLINELIKSNEYDMILFDTPPVLGLSDSTLIAENTDGVIILVGLGSVDRALPKESINRIRVSGATLLGAVTNSTRESSDLIGARYDNYSYSGRYGYQYSPLQTYERYSEIDENNSEDSLKKNSLKSIDQIKNPIILKIYKIYNRYNKIRKSFIKWLDN